MGLKIKVHPRSSEDFGASACSLGAVPTGVVRFKDEAPAKVPGATVLEDVGASKAWDDLKAVLTGLFIRGFDNPTGKYFYVKSDYRNHGEALHSVYFRGTHMLAVDIHVLGSSIAGDEPTVAIVNQGLEDASFETICEVIEPVLSGWFNTVGDGNHGMVVRLDDPSEYETWKKVSHFKNETVQPLSKIYGDGAIDTHENSASGFYVDNYDPMGYAILNNDVATMKDLFSGRASVPDKPWLYAGWHEDLDAPEGVDGSYPYVYDWGTERELNFVNDWKRIVGKTNNEAALKFLLENDPDFILASADFENAIHAGYDKGLLRKLFDNICSVMDTESIASYFGDDLGGDDAYDNINTFLS